MRLFTLRISLLSLLSSLRYSTACSSNFTVSELPTRILLRDILDIHSISYNRSMSSFVDSGALGTGCCDSGEGLRTCTSGPLAEPGGEGITDRPGSGGGPLKAADRGGMAGGVGSVLALVGGVGRVLVISGIDGGGGIDFSMDLGGIDTTGACSISGCCCCLTTGDEPT